ncbi:MAG: YbjN domain-containing protein [Pirellulales bacterium]
MSRTLVHGAVLFFAIAGLTLATRTEARAQDEVFETMSAGRVERIMKDLELANVTEIDNNTYRFEFEGLKILLFNKGETMQLYAGFSGAKISLSRINEWNRTKRFTRAYLDKDNDPVLEGDIELTGGVTDKNVKEWVKTYQVSIRAYKKHLEE